MSWLLFCAIGLGTLLIRASFLLRDEKTESERFGPIRRFVPIAVLTALVVPALLPKNGEPIYARAIAAAVAAFVAYRFENMLATVAVGVAILIVLH